MSYVMTAAQFVATAERLATDYKTLYVMGAFGAPMTAANKTRYINNGSAGGYNKQAARAKKINAATEDTYGLDCCGLTKAILWGWSGDKSRVYGGAGYACNGVPDLDARGLINACRDVSTTGWDTMLPGEEVWMDGHCGIYVGRGLVVESTPIWRDGVQYSAVANIGPKAGYNARKWTKHGKLPWVDYNTNNVPNPGGEDDMDQEKFNQMFEVAMQAYRTKLRDNDSSEFSELARAWGIEHGIIQGGGKLDNGETNYMWEDLQTREQGVVMMYRLAVALGLA